MPRSLQEILDQSDELAKRFEDYEPTAADRRPVEPLHRARAAVLAKTKVEAELAAAVAEMRSSGYSWATIGSVLGTSGEAARQRYGDVPAVQPVAGHRSVPRGRVVVPGGGSSEKVVLEPAPVEHVQVQEAPVERVQVEQVPRDEVTSDQPQWLTQIAALHKNHQ